MRRIADPCRRSRSRRRRGSWLARRRRRRATRRDRSPSWSAIRRSSRSGSRAGPRSTSPRSAAPMAAGIGAFAPPVAGTMPPSATRTSSCPYGSASVPDTSRWAPRDGAAMPDGSRTKIPPDPSPSARSAELPVRPGSRVTKPSTVTVEPSRGAPHRGDRRHRRDGRTRRARRTARGDRRYRAGRIGGAGRRDRRGAG